MATSEAEISNQALGHLGRHQNFVTDLEADQTEEAENCRIFIATARDVVLAVYHWPFAKARQELVELTDEDARDEWEHVFALPDDCIIPRYIRPVGLGKRALSRSERIPFTTEKSSQSEASVLLCDLPNPLLIYTARITEPTRFSAPFSLLLSYKLAELIARPLTGQVAARNEMRQAYMIELGIVTAGVSNAEQEDEEPETDYLKARR